MSFNKSGSKYLRAVPCITEGKIDVYAVLDAFNVTCPARQHAIKKLLCTGIRGKGDTIQDLREAADAVTRAVQMEEQRQICPAAIADVKRDMGEGFRLDPDHPLASKKHKAERKASLCHSCHQDTCPKEKIVACEEFGSCVQYLPAPETKQDTPTAAVLPLDFTLPSIALKCTAEEAVEKFLSEMDEWGAAKEGSLHELVEKWDCLQALYTAYQRGADVDWYQDNVRTVMAYLTEYAAEGRDVMKARRGMLLKNAKRPNPEGGTGYYSPEVCAAIIASGGNSWK